MANQLNKVIHYPETNSVEVTWVDEGGKPVRCHSYADVQMDMLRADLGSAAGAYEALIATVEAGIVPPSPSPMVVPYACTRRQGRLALLGAGKLATAEALIASIPDETAKRKAEIEYESDTWERANPFLQQMWSYLGGTSAELDALFSTAVTL